MHTQSTDIRNDSRCADQGLGDTHTDLPKLAICLQIACIPLAICADCGFGKFTLTPISRWLFVWVRFA